MTCRHTNESNCRDSRKRFFSTARATRLVGRLVVGAAVGVCVVIISFRSECRYSVPRSATTAGLQTTGLVLGWAGIEQLLRGADRSMAELAWWHFPAALAVAAATGFLFSIVPAWSASGLDPVDALRNE